MPRTPDVQRHLALAHQRPARSGSLPDPGRWLLIPLVLIALLVFSPVFDADFTARDDMQTVAQNPRMLGPWSGVGRFWRTIDEGNGNLYLPVTQTAWYLIARIARLDRPTPDGIRLNPIFFHLANVFLHALGGALVFLILRELVANAWAAAAGALLFLIHPLQVEAVAWVTGLRDVLSGTLCLLAIYEYMQFVRKQLQPTDVQRAASRWKSPAWGSYCLALAAFVLCVLAKPSGVIAPLLAAVLGIVLVYKSPAGESEQNAALKGSRLTTGWRIAILPLIPWLIVGAAIIVIERHAQPAIGAPNVSLWLRPVIAADALAFYLWKLVLPTSLGIDYARTPAAVIHSAAIWWTWLIPAALLAITILVARRRPLLSAAALVFCCGLLPVLGLIKFDFQVHSTVADRYVYVSMLGAALALAALLEKARRAALAWVAAAMVLAVCGALTFAQAGYWKNDFALFDHAAEVNPRSYIARAHLGRIYAEQGDTADAVAQYREALQIKPDDAALHRNLGNLLLMQGQPSQAAEEFRAALPSQPRDAGLRNNLGIALAQMGRLSEARESFTRATEFDPRDVQSQINLAKVLAQLGDKAGAAERYRRAMAIDPKQAEARHGLDQLGLREGG